ncbi:MAG: hypothetical protein MJZ38_00850 [archaeon]|nr:hypothetical protein [archaeon]
MRSGIAIAIAVAVVLCCISVGAVYAYNSSYSDEFGQQVIHTDHGELHITDSTVEYRDHDRELKYAILEVEATVAGDAAPDTMALTLGGKDYSSGVFDGKVKFSMILLNLEPEEHWSSTGDLPYSFGSDVDDIRFRAVHLEPVYHILTADDVQEIHHSGELINLDLPEGRYHFDSDDLQLYTPQIVTSFSEGDEYVQIADALYLLLIPIPLDENDDLEGDKQVAFYMPDKDLTITKVTS